MIFICIFLVVGIGAGTQLAFDQNKKSGIFSNSQSSRDFPISENQKEFPLRQARATAPGDDCKFRTPLTMRNFRVLGDAGKHEASLDGLE